MDMDKVFDALRKCITEPKCKDCLWETCKEYRQTKTIPLDLCLDILKLLKKQEGTINELQNAYDYLLEQFFEAQDKLLKEQEKDRLEIAHEMVSGSILMYQGKEIVRCKDCKWNSGTASYPYCQWFSESKPPIWFCANGELKE